MKKFEQHKIDQESGNVTVIEAGSVIIKVWTHMGQDFDKKVVQFTVIGSVDDIHVSQRKKRKK